MGREVRMVPKDWQHPKQSNRHIPLIGRPFSKEFADWEEDAAQWGRGKRRQWSVDSPDTWVPIKSDDLFEEWVGEPPRREDYMPEFAEGTATYFMMYEDCSEGTPISPAFDTPEKLARWLADNNASAFGSMTATYEQWLATIKQGWAVSAVCDSKGLRSGVESSNEITKGE